MATNARAWSRSALNKTFADRSLRVLVTPTPIGLAERRSILHVLQQTGAVDVFTMVPNYPHQFISVMREAKATDKLARLGNITYSIKRPPKQTEIAFRDLRRPELLDGTKATIYPADVTPALDEDGQERKEFRLHILRLEDYNHAGTQDKSPLNRAWPSSYTRSPTFTSMILRQSLPCNPAAKGFSHWDYNLGDQGAFSPKNERRQLREWIPSNMTMEKKEKEKPPQQEEAEEQGPAT